MKEKDLIKLGFERTDVSPEESGEEHPFYYYTWNPNDSPRSFCLISDSNDEVKDIKDWKVHVFEHDITFTDKKDVKQLIKIIKKGSNYES